MGTDFIETGMGTFSKRKFDALTNVREVALDSFRKSLKERGYREVTTSSLVNIAGSCENPQASFTLNYYGREAHLSQSAQVQLEALVLRQRRGFFTINNSFREEHFDDPEAAGRRLSEFTLIEPEKPYEGMTPDQALDALMAEEEEIINHAITEQLMFCRKDVEELGGDLNYLTEISYGKPFLRLTYSGAIFNLNKLHHGSVLIIGKPKYNFGDDLGIKEERMLLKAFGNRPIFVTHYPASIKFFNMKRNGEKVYSADLLMPPLGETIGGAVREEDGRKVRKYLVESKLGKYLIEKGQKPEVPFAEYLKLFEQEDPLLRGGYGIGFERFVAFLINSNDILNTIAYRTLQPS